MRKINSYLYQSKNDTIKKRSSSGGAFYDLAEKAIKRQYYVSGCVWDSKLEAKHTVSNTLEDVQRMQGSKYVQSEMGETYKIIISLLQKDEKVLFSGTPCQASAVGKLASKINKRHNLLSVAIVCHGVASPLAWKTYKLWDEKQVNSKLIHVNFRNKDKEGYKNTYTKYEYESGKSIYRPTYLPTNKFIEATLVYNLGIRKSCEKCLAKGYNENIDIVLGDWHSEYKGEGKLGTSCIITYSLRGDKYVMENLTGLREIDYSMLVKKNECIEKSIVFEKNRDYFFDAIKKDYENWKHIEKLYPLKYQIKKLLVKLKIYDVLKGKI